ncbi:hypothetical protein A0H81_11400 [Grifola frondosa]|uniref:Uncharacterized protein n=1 Tax=Grifola frondosa TaxID=5627 RepID=A0A1C7LVD9_GRIFR|nr:hypothetical protein A0H81_11400 [Grifola frondosa]
MTSPNSDVVADEPRSITAQEDAEHNTARDFVCIDTPQPHLKHREVSLTSVWDTSDTHHHINTCHLAIRHFSSGGALDSQTTDTQYFGQLEGGASVDLKAQLHPHGITSINHKAEHLKDPPSDTPAPKSDNPCGSCGSLHSRMAAINEHRFEYRRRWLEAMYYALELEDLLISEGLQLPSRRCPHLMDSDASPSFLHAPSTNVDVKQESYEREVRALRGHKRMRA